MKLAIIQLPGYKECYEAAIDDVVEQSDSMTVAMCLLMCEDKNFAALKVKDQNLCL